MVTALWTCDHIEMRYICNSGSLPQILSIWAETFADVQILMYNFKVQSTILTIFFAHGNREEHRHLSVQLLALAANGAKIESCHNLYVPPPLARGWGYWGWKADSCHYVSEEIHKKVLAYHKSFELQFWRENLKTQSIFSSLYFYSFQNGGYSWKNLLGILDWPIIRSVIWVCISHTCRTVLVYLHKY